MLNNYFDKQYELRYFEMNKFGVASPTTILTLLEETAADHCGNIDYNLYQLAEKNIGWVLLGGVMQMERYPIYKEKITIRTWLSKYSSIKGCRENIIYDAQNNIIGRAKGLWVFFDINKRRPVRIFDDIIKKWSFCSMESISVVPLKQMTTIEHPDYEAQFKVHKADTDLIKHVNNIKYLEWLLESVPMEITDNYYLHTINGKFISEIYYGQSVISSTKKSSDDQSFIHAITTADTNKICAVAETSWRKV